MKAKAASKSTNLKLRVIASRSFASCQSGKRFNACFKSSIVSFAMETSQRIVLFDAVDAAVAGQLAGIETEAAHGEFNTGRQRVIGQPITYLFHIRVAQPCERHMRGE